MNPKELVEGKKYCINSGMGGVFTVRYDGHFPNGYVFANLNKEFKKLMPRFLLTDDRVKSQITPY